jgi:2-methylcitrate dehydratase PrpD
VRVQPIDERDPDEPVHSPFDQVVVATRDGRVLEGPRVTHPVGHFRNPADADRLWLKFSECTAEALPPTAAANLFGTLRNLADVRRLADLQAAIMPARIAS